MAIMQRTQYLQELNATTRKITLNHMNDVLPVAKIGPNAEQPTIFRQNENSRIGTSLSPTVVDEREADNMVRKVMG
jgi:hypothetical protein